jgi:hypothetical protein
LAAIGTTAQAMVFLPSIRTKLRRTRTRTSAPAYLFAREKIILCAISPLPLGKNIAYSGRSLVSRKDLKNPESKQGLEMKRKGHIFEKMCDPEVIREAIKQAARNKKNRHDVKRVLADMDGHVAIIKRLLEEQTFAVSPYVISERYDPHNKKTRLIQHPKFFPDQVIHWIIVTALKDVLMGGMYYWNCGSVPGRGTKHGRIAVRRWIDKDWKNTKYALQLDIKKFYDSIPHDGLMSLMRSKIKDERALWLVQKIIDSVETGIPLGNYTSQWFANFYLVRLDHYIKEALKVKYYVRYIDDLVLFGRNKKELHKIRQKLFVFIEQKLSLKVKSNWQLFPVKARGLDFLGYVFFHTHTKMRARNFLALMRQCRKIKKRVDAGKPIPYKMASGLISRAGQLKYCNGRKIKNPRRRAAGY